MKSVIAFLLVGLMTPLAVEAGPLDWMKSLFGVRAQAPVPSAFDLADRNALIEAHERINGAVEISLSEPSREYPRYSSILVKEVNKLFFDAYDYLYEVDRNQNSTEYYESRDMMERMYGTSIKSIPPELAGPWIMAMASIKAWETTGIKPPKVKRVEPNPTNFLVFEDKKIRQQILEAFSNQLNEELSNAPNVEFQIALLISYGNHAQYFGELPELSETAADKLRGINEYSYFASLTQGIALTSLASINTVESWSQFLMAYSGWVNISVPRGTPMLTEKMDSLFLQGSSPERDQALAGAEERILKMEIKGDEGHRADSRREEGLRSVRALQSQVAKLQIVPICALSLSTND